MVFRPDIQGLRGISVLAVVIFHLGVGLPGGFVGVDVFFVISGFLMTGLIAEEFDKRATLSEAEAVLVSGAVSHNHLLFRASAIDACLSLNDWLEMNRHAAQLESYTHGEPLPWAAFHIGRARVLARLASDGLDHNLTYDAWPNRSSRWASRSAN